MRVVCSEEKMPVCETLQAVKYSCCVAVLLNLYFPQTLIFFGMLMVKHSYLPSFVRFHSFQFTTPLSDLDNPVKKNQNKCLGIGNNVLTFCVNIFITKSNFSLSPI